MQTNDDIRMRYLSGLLMIFVILGHMMRLSTTVFTFDNWFPFYSFHMAGFLFISGYFYKDKNDSEIGRFLLKKAKTLLIPFFVWNLVFLLLQTALRPLGFTLGSTFSFHEWLVQPWIDIQPRTLAIPSWYLIALFISFVMYVLLRKLFLLLFRNEKVREFLLLAVLLLLGMAAAVVNSRYVTGMAAVVYLRSVVMLFFLQLGFVYKKFLEKHDTMKNRYYFLIILVLQFLLLVVMEKLGLSSRFGLFALENFRKGGIFFYVLGILGIALWLRISSILATLPKQIGILKLIGENTKYIMIFHVFGFFILNLILYFVSQLTGFFLFDSGEFFSHIYYTVESFPQMSLVYLFFGLGISLGISLLIGRVKDSFHKKRAEKTGGI